MNSSDQPKRGLKFSGAPPYAQSSERIREAFANQGIAGARLTGRDVSDDQIYREVGYRDANEYWRVVMSEPMEISSFVHLLKGYFFNPALDGCDQYHLEIDAALHFASDIEEPWFIKVPNKEIMVHPRKAAEWLLSLPKRRHLLPPGLTEFLEFGDKPASLEQGANRTGAPGRPSSMHLVLVESSRRRESGEAVQSVTAEAKILKEWFDKNHAGMPVLTAKTIENNIRDKHNGWKG
jgi:hypothetical protein